MSYFWPLTKMSLIRQNVISIYFISPLNIKFCENRFIIKKIAYNFLFSSLWVQELIDSIFRLKYLEFQNSILWHFCLSKPIKFIYLYILNFFFSKGFLLKLASCLGGRDYHHLNKKSVRMEPLEIELARPKDRWDIFFLSNYQIIFKIVLFRLNIVYLIMLLHGIGALMPWNMFITAKDVSSFFNISSTKF